MPPDCGVANCGYSIARSHGAPHRRRPGKCAAALRFGDPSQAPFPIEPRNTRGQVIGEGYPCVQGGGRGYPAPAPAPKKITRRDVRGFIVFLRGSPPARQRARSAPRSRPDARRPNDPRRCGCRARRRQAATPVRDPQERERERGHPARSRVAAGPPTHPPGRRHSPRRPVAPGLERGGGSDSLSPVLVDDPHALGEGSLGLDRRI
jgi:hypothetical protein